MAHSRSDLRAAAQLRAAGMQARGVDRRQYRSQVPGVGARREVTMGTQVRAKMEKRNGKDMIHTSGYFTRYNRPYPMWDQYGEYEEVVTKGAGARTLAANPDVAFLLNHRGLTMARTRNGTLTLEERPEGGWHDAWLNPERQDVRDLASAIEDELVTEMSYAFLIPDGSDGLEPGGWWNEDFTLFEVRRYDINRGDVSAVNYGANPYTDIAARTAEVLRDVEHLPAGALREVMDRVERRAGEDPSEWTPTTRERIEVRSSPRGGSVGSHVRRLQSRVARTAGRFVDLAARQSLTVAELPLARLPWYEIRNAEGGAEDRPGDDSATIFIYDEIGGSFGVDAKAFAEELETITAPEITVRINSPGGSVFDALAIHSSLLHHPAHIKVYIDSLAASAASVIAMAGDEIVMMPGSQMMIHDASAVHDGNAAEMQKMVTFLDRQSANISDLYARRAGGDPNEWREMMLAETWAFASEAVELGLADRVHESASDRSTADGEMVERMQRSFDLSPYRYAGRRSAPAPDREAARAAAQRLNRAAGDGIGDREPLAVDTVRQAMDVAASKAPDTADVKDAGPIDSAMSTAEQPVGRTIGYYEMMLEIDPSIPQH